MISLKYKLLFVLLAIPSITTGLYYLVAKNIFEKDKEAYIFEANIQGLQNLSNEILLPIKKIEKIIWYAKTHTKLLNNNETKKFIQDNLKLVNEIEYFALVEGPNTILSSLEDLAVDERKTLNENKLNPKAIIDLEQGRGFQVISDPTSNPMKENSDDENPRYLIYQEWLNNEIFLHLEFSLKNFERIIEQTPFDYLIIQNSHLATQNVNNNSEQNFENSLIARSYIDNQLRNTFDQFFEKQNKLQAGFQAKMITLLNNETYLYSSGNLDDYGLKILALYSWEKALIPLRELTLQSALFFIITACLTIIVALFFATRLTLGLKKLTNATDLISEENYDEVVNINSRDEVGVLAKAFNQMTSKIQALLTELRRYNEELEIMVQERTAQLSDALRLQKAIMDSVDQGFAIFDNTGTMKGSASKSAHLHFNKNLEENTPIYPLFESVLPADDLKNLLQILFDETLPFEDCAGLLPEKLLFSVNQQEEDFKHIFLEYYPFYSEEKKLIGLVVVSSDKTAEVKALEQQKREKMKSQMILSVTSSPGEFKTILEHTAEVLEMLQNPENHPVSQIFIQVHTIKASLLIFGLYDHAMIFHSIEDLLSGQEEIDKEIATKIKDKHDQLKELFSQFFVEYGQVFGLESFERLNAYLNLRLEKEIFDQFIQKISNYNQSLADLILKQLFSVRSSRFTEFFKKLTYEVAKRQGKNVQFKTDESQRIMDYGLDDFKAELVHVFSNAVNHGIENSLDREEKGKPAYGTINFLYQEDKSNQYFIIQDDGAGINTTKIKEKLIKLGRQEAEKWSEEKLQQVIFEDSFSTNETVDTTAGRGVGMAAVKKQVEVMGGEILIHSYQDKGTQFVFKLPKTSKKNSHNYKQEQLRH